MGELVPISMFTVIGLILFAFLYFRYRAARETQDTIRQAIEKGHELSPDLLARMGQPLDQKQADLRRGVIAVALGISFAVFAVILGEEDAVRPLVAGGAFPFLIGVAYLGLWRFSKYPD